MNLKIIWAVLNKEFKLAERHALDYVLNIIFWLLMICLFPLAISPDPVLLQKIAPGILWIGIIFSQLLSLAKIFREDYHDGSLAELIKTPASFTLLISSKLFAYWLITTTPLLLFSPILALILQLPLHAYWILLATLFLATPIISLLNAFGSALTLALRQNSLLINLLLLPLQIPVLIFAASAVSNASEQLAYNGQLAWLGVLLIIALLGLPYTISAAVKMSYQ